MSDVQTDYLHALAGRLRVKVSEIKRAPGAARRLETQLRAVDGVAQVQANATTGNVLVEYDENRIQQPDVLRAIRALGFLRPSPAAPPTPAATPAPARRPVSLASRPAARHASRLGQRMVEDLAISACLTLLKYGCRAVIAAVA